MDTKRLIEELAKSAQPVRRLPRPEYRLLFWLATTLPTVLLIAWAAGIRPDLAAKTTEPLFIIQVSAALLTAVSAAWATLSAVVPGEPRWKLAVPLIPFGVWMAAIGQQCWSEWRLFGAAGMEFRPDPACIPAIAVIGAAPAVIMVTLIRRGAVLQPRLTVFLGALAAAALGHFGLRLSHPTDAGLMVLVWQVGTVAGLSALAALCGRAIAKPLA